MSNKYTSHSVLSAIMVLQEAEVENKYQSRLWNMSLFDLSFPDISAWSHWIGVSFLPQKLYEFFEKKNTQYYTPQLKAGDLYIFSASRIHEVFDLQGVRDRVIVGTFLAWDEDNDEVYLFQ
jgi:hypothetical protein